MTKRPSVLRLTHPNQKTTFTMHADFSEIINHVQIVLPTLVRISLPFAKECVAHVWHKTIHHGIHKAEHRFSRIGRLLHKRPWLIDAVIIVAMLGFESTADMIHGDHEAHGQE